jgi:hypothetical protein
LFYFCNPILAHAQEVGPVLRIEHPYEGETIYIGPSTPRYNLPIVGSIRLGKYGHDEIQLHLAVFQEDLLVSSATTKPTADGQFIFYALVNPLSPDLVLPLGGDCGENCHYPINVEVDLSLPQGKILLRVTAFANGELMGLAERNIVVDRSNLVRIPVEIHFLGDTKVVEGIRISASTRLYLWRARHFSTVSGLDGRALIEVESLSEGPTHYLFEIEPTVIDGLLYEGVEPVEMILPARATSIPSVTLQVKATAGQITGQVNSPQKNLIPSFPIWAIHLPDGTSYQSTISPEGSVAFSDIPIGQYLLTANDHTLVKEGYQLENQLVDLANSPHTSVDLSLSPTSGTFVTGEVSQAGGLPIPFAWVTIEELRRTQAVLPDSGIYLFSRLPSKDHILIASAPGHYSKAYRTLTDSAIPVNVSLLPRPETRCIPWGQGEIVLPPETTSRMEGQRIYFERGWLWGQGGEMQALVIALAEGEIEISAGHFALEKVPGKMPWFYLFDGKAILHWEGVQESISLESGQMVALVSHPIPVSYNPVVLTALNRPEMESPLPFTWQPTLQAQIRDYITRIGIGTTQLITFVTYIMVVISIVFGPFIGIYWWRKHRRKK